MSISVNDIADKESGGGWKGTTLRKRFWKKVDFESYAPCWIWTGAMSSGSHGQIRVGTTTKSAARVAYELTYGDIDSDFHVFHMCENPRCVNPEHLEKVLHSSVNTLERLMRRVKVSENGCWEWQRMRDINGYGRTSLNGRQILAHRLAWELLKEPIPADMLVLHQCDNAACVNPEHLYLGTVAENVQDALERNRCSFTRLNPRKVRLIRKMYSEGRSFLSMSRQFGVSPTTVSRAAKRESWKFVK